MSRGESRPVLSARLGASWVREIMGLLYVIHNRRLVPMLGSFRRKCAPPEMTK